MSIASLAATGTKVWLDSVDPDLVRRFVPLGVTGATSNPVIVSDLVKTGRFDELIETFIERGMDDSAIAWNLTDWLVSEAQEMLFETWRRTGGDDGYVSFELDPLLEDPASAPHHARRVRDYEQLGRYWAKGYVNRMIKVPATAAGIAALEGLAAAGVPLNVTLMFTPRQYHAARDAVWRGMQRRGDLRQSKSVYSIFLSRIDVYASKRLPDVSPEARDLLGIAVGRRIWRENREFWKDKGLPLRQEIIFASTGAKLEGDAPDKYVAALAGGDIQTNPPETLEAAEHAPGPYVPRLGERSPRHLLDEIDTRVDLDEMERVLMEEGVEKFAKPMKALIALVAERRASLAGVV